MYSFPPAPITKRIVMGTWFFCVALGFFPPILIGVIFIIPPFSILLPGTMLAWLIPVVLVAVFGFLFYLLYSLRPSEYLIGEDKLLVKRSGLFRDWERSLHGLISVEIVPKFLMNKKLATGSRNNGIFCITGLYYDNDRKLIYRAFLTSEKSYVLLRFEDVSIAVSPQNPEEFSRVLENYVGK